MVRYPCEKCYGSRFTGLLWWTKKCDRCAGTGYERPPDRIGPLPPPPPPKKDVCTICHRRHITEADYEASRNSGNLTALNVAKAQEAYRHYMHEQAMKQTPPEYVV
jgi:RecJ-like exonuclease